MNGTVRKIFQGAAEQTGFRIDENAGILYGVSGGYHFSVEMTNNRYYLYASVNRNGMLPEAGVLKNASKYIKSILGGSLKANKSLFLLRSGTRKKAIGHIVTAIRELPSYLRQNGLNDSCERCGRPDLIGFYGVGGKVEHLCPDCFTGASQGVMRSETAYHGTKENVVAGIVGALAGSLLGGAAIVLVGQLGYVAAISGVIMGVCTLKGYEMLGKKITIKGIVICSLIMIFMVYASARMDWAIDVVKEFGSENVDIFTAYRVLPELVKEAGGMTQFISMLVMVYGFTALGAVPIMVNSLREQKKSFDVYRLDGGMGTPMSGENQNGLY